MIPRDSEKILWAMVLLLMFGGIAPPHKVESHSPAHGQEPETPVQPTTISPSIYNSNVSVGSVNNHYSWTTDDGTVFFIPRNLSSNSEIETDGAVTQTPQWITDISAAYDFAMSGWREVQQNHSMENDGKHLVYNDDHWTAQVCLAGHVQNGGMHVIQTEKFCGDCGAELIHQCPSCNNNIKGAFRAFADTIDSPPAFCQKCGKPYPWTETALKSVAQIIDDSDLTAAEKRETTNDLEIIVRNSPGAQVAAHRTKRRLMKMGEVARVAYLDYIVPLASETIAKIFKQS
jgi:hypothetical protein